MDAPDIQVSKWEKSSDDNEPPGRVKKVLTLFTPKHGNDLNAMLGRLV